MPLVLDPKKTQLHAFTGSQGLFSRFAHDLDIVADEIEGEADNGGESAAGTARLRIGLAGLKIAGVVTRGKTDEHALGQWEKRQIVGRMRDEVFQGTDITADVTLMGDKATVTVATKSGRQSVVADVAVDRTRASVVVRGACTLSLRALGIAPIKAPMNAFTVADAVRVRFDATFS